MIIFGSLFWTSLTEHIENMNEITGQYELSKSTDLEANRGHRA